MLLPPITAEQLACNVDAFENNMEFVPIREFDSPPKILDLSPCK